MSRADFTRHWQLVHGPLIGELPGLRGYVQNAIKHDVHRPGDDGRTFHADGVVELYFDSAEDMNAAFDSEIGDKIRADEDNFLGTSSGYSLAGDAVRRSAVCPDKFIIAIGEEASFWDAGKVRENLQLTDEWEIGYVQARFGAKAGPMGPQPVGAFLQAIRTHQADPQAILEVVCRALDDTGWRGALSVFHVRETRIL